MATLVKSDSLGSLCKARTPKAQSSMSISKVNSCTYITSSNLGRSAHPFYFRRSVDSICADINLGSTYKESWSSHVYKNRPACNIGSQRKPLVPYDANHQRSRMGLPKIKSFGETDLKNSFSIATMMKKGKNTKSKKGHLFKTTYKTSYDHPEKQREIRRRLVK